MDTLLGGHLHLADIFLSPVECNGLNILKHLLNGHSIKRTQIIVKCANFVKILRFQRNFEKFY